jgi:DNA-binding NtrC family response regulator
MVHPNPDADGHQLHQLRCLHELARQILPLASAAEIARDGLLCIAGITGIGAGCLWWRYDAGASFELSAAFGLETGALRASLRPAATALRTLQQAGPTSLDAARRRPALRGLARACGISREAWLLALGGDGILVLGPSLVTGRLVEPAAWIAQLGDVLRLGMIGSRERGRAVRAGTARNASGGTAVRLRALRRAHPATSVLVGESPATLGMLEEIVALADTDYTVLLEGETGTGKELAAQLLHRLGRRARGPFEAVDCSAIPSELVESELFGHVKGAFTGAHRDFRGAFERADGGTLLLDEIGDMDLRSQTRLLRVLQEGQVRPVGSDRPIRVDVRVVAASHRDLAAQVHAGSFREDLYYRIHVCWLRLPPLRERGDDRVLLFERGLETQAKSLGRPPRSLTAASRRRLRAEEFPGNIRQLQNVVQQLLARKAGRGPIEIEELEAVLERSTAVAAARAALPRRTERERENPPAVGAAAPASTRARVDSRPITALTSDELASALDVGAAAVEDVGAWVVDQLRRQGFNLRATALRLARLRKLGATRAVVPVFDRGAIDYHLCGEFMRRLAAHRYDVEAALSDIAGRRDWVPRLRRKVRAYLRPLLESETASLAELTRRFGRIPERYQDDVRAAIEAWRAGKWQLP